MRLMGGEGCSPASDLGVQCRLEILRGPEWWMWQGRMLGVHCFEVDDEFCWGAIVVTGCAVWDVLVKLEVLDKVGMRFERLMDSALELW
jgi:hypothetical protein